jgi:C4-dicarboxylate-specific signal transduction histidine kinase
MNAEFKDGDMASGPPSNMFWHRGFVTDPTVAPDLIGRRDAAKLEGKRAMARLARPTMRSYGTALLLVAVALVSTLLLRSLFPYPFLYLFFPAVMASAWIGGRAAGLFAVFLSTVGVAYFFVPPFYSFSINATDTTYFGAFIVCALVASWVSASKKKSEETLTEARDLLEYRVSERTTELRKSNTELRRSIEEHRKAQLALMKTQAELAHLSRVFTMGELTSSIAHEVNQPLTAVVTNGHACLEWLSASPPDLREARESAERIIQDGTRAGKVLGHIRSLFKKEAPARDWLSMNDVIQDLTVFLRGEAMSQRIALRMDLAADLPRVRGDRVQLQQVVLNLIMNGIEAMRGTADRPKEIWIRSRRDESAGVRIVVEDGGVGLSPEIAEKIFQPFFTTKDQGIGMGLSISRSIVESHAGRLWAAPGPSGGAVFQFTIPTES